jgi:hypothetical protein
MAIPQILNNEVISSFLTFILVKTSISAADAGINVTSEGKILYEFIVFIYNQDIHHSKITERVSSDPISCMKV